MQSIGIKTTTTEHSTDPINARQFYDSWMCNPHRGRAKSEIHLCTKIVCSSSIGIKDLYTLTAENIHICKGILSDFLRFQIFWTYILGDTQADHYPHGQQIGNQIPPDKDNTSGTLECLQLRYSIQLFYRAHPRQKQYQSRLLVPHGNGF